MPPLHFLTRPDTRITNTNSIPSYPTRSSNGNKTTPASGPSTATSPGTSPAAFTQTSWSAPPISKTCSSPRHRIRIVGIGPIIRGQNCCRRSIRGCDGNGWWVGVGEWIHCRIYNFAVFNGKKVTRLVIIQAITNIDLCCQELGRYPMGSRWRWAILEGLMGKSSGTMYSKCSSRSHRLSHLLSR